MANRILAGAIAGAAGVVALNAASYVDMLVRGRSGDEAEAERDDAGEDVAANRRDAMGGLPGMVNGIGIGVVYGIARLILPRPPAWLAGAALGAAAMAASDDPATRLGATEPRDWSATNWASDVLPHMAFGLVTAVAFEAAHD
jgi:hypothetical protein